MLATPACHPATRTYSTKWPNQAPITAVSRTGHLSRHLDGRTGATPRAIPAQGTVSTLTPREPPRLLRLPSCGGRRLVRATTQAARFAEDAPAAAYAGAHGVLHELCERRRVPREGRRIHRRRPTPPGLRVRPRRWAPRRGRRAVDTSRRPAPAPHRVADGRSSRVA